MDRLAHKTDIQKRSISVRFHPFVFLPERMRTACDRSGATGNDPREGWRIPLNEINYNEQRDEETGIGYCDTYQPHAPRRIKDTENQRLYDLQWDNAGNLGQRNRAKEDGFWLGSRHLFWTEDNRMHAVIDASFYSYYTYDYTGERTLKLVGRNNEMDVNAEIQHTAAVLDRPTLYPSPYVVLGLHGYTKHYYAGTERICAKIGGGFGTHFSEERPDLQETANKLFEQSREDILHRELPQNDLNCIASYGDVPDEDLKVPLYGVPYYFHTEAVTKLKRIHKAVEQCEQETEEEDKVFFYHSDHLGSASWITNRAGDAIQHLQYLPYGAPFVDQRTTGYHERFTFTGKERDEETGYGYFGARYMDHVLTTMWLSVDPMADKYPSISPYVYCAWNPVKLVDPDGKDPIYGKIFGTVKKIGDDGKNDGKVYYVTRGKKYSVLWATLWGYDYTGSLEVSENVFHVPTGNIANDVQLTISMVKQSGECEHCIESQVEYGAHSLIGSDHAEIWDPGIPMESGRINEKYTYKRWSITPFMQDDEPMTIDFPNVEFVWHVQPDNSIPSKRDKDAAFDYTYNRGMENATWFVVGARDGKVTFLSGLGRCHTIDMKDFKKMSQQE